jgi:hypothetical protein
MFNSCYVKILVYGINQNQQKNNNIIATFNDSIDINLYNG